jgi:hypothetical protein
LSNREPVQQSIAERAAAKRARTERRAVRHMRAIRTRVDAGEAHIIEDRGHDRIE